MNGRRLTDEELNEIISQPRPSIKDGYTRKVAYSDYFDKHQLWKSMDKRRMISICRDIQNLPITAEQFNKVEAIKLRLMSELEQA